MPARAAYAAGGGEGGNAPPRPAEPARPRFGGIKQCATADTNHHAGVIARRRHQIGDVTFAAVPFKEQMFRPRCVKAFRQERARAFNGAFAINPHRAGELFRRKEIIQVRKASRMREIVRRARHDADIGVAHVLSFF